MVRCHIPGKIFKVLSLLDADSYRCFAPSGSHIVSAPPCMISIGLPIRALLGQLSLPILPVGSARRRSSNGYPPRWCNECSSWEKLLEWPNRHTSIAIAPPNDSP